MIYLKSLIALVILGATANAGEKTATRALAISTLHDFQNCLEKRDFKKALTFLKLPKEADGMEDKVLQELTNLAKTTELTKKGIDVLAKKGEWNTLAKIQGEKEASRMSHGLPADRCFGLFAGSRRGAAFYWDGSRLFITYFNNIGRLEME